MEVREFAGTLPCPIRGLQVTCAELLGEFDFHIDIWIPSRVENELDRPDYS